MKLKSILLCLSILCVFNSCDEEDLGDDRIFVTVEIDLRNQVNNTCHDNDITYVVNDVADDIQTDFSVRKGSSATTEVTTRYGDFINLQAYYTNDNTNRLLAEANIDTRIFGENSEVLWELQVYYTECPSEPKILSIRQN